jgi:hypothetical protein
LQTVWLCGGARLTVSSGLVGIYRVNALGGYGPGDRRHKVGPIFYGLVREDQVDEMLRQLEGYRPGFGALRVTDLRGGDVVYPEAIAEIKIGEGETQAEFLLLRMEMPDPRRAVATMALAANLWQDGMETVYKNGSQ